MKRDAADVAQADAIRPWLVRAGALVTNRLRDARAHAEAGRFPDAASRLHELAVVLGEDVLHPAREKFLRDSFRTHSQELDPAIVDQTVTPSRSMAHAAKHAPIMGVDQAGDLRRLAETAHDELRLAAFTNHTDATIRGAAHETWETRHRGRIKSAITSHLANAQVAIHNAVGDLMIKPELR